MAPYVVPLFFFNIIAIDGPSGSGKGTIAKEVARRLNYTYIDTGAMYRCVALKSLEDNISLDEEDKIVDLLKNMDIRLTNDGKVYMDNEDVSDEIRSKEVTYRVSKPEYVEVSDTLTLDESEELSIDLVSFVTGSEYKVKVTLFCENKVASSH